VELTDPDDVQRAIEDARPGRIFHLAGAPSVAGSWKSAEHLRINVMGTHHLLDAVRRADRPCRVLVVSSALIYQGSEDPLHEDAPLRPASPYGLSKLAQDELARRAATDDELDIVVARPFNHIGPRQSTDYAVASFAWQIARIEAGLAPPVMQVGNLEPRRDVTDVRDVTRAYERLMEDGVSGRAYNVCSGRGWRIRDLLDELLHQSTAAISVEHDRSRFRPSDVTSVQGDATRIRTELGWAPQIAVEQTLQDTLDWWRGEVKTGLT
jgi:GDP-4-dehydro-6-deoxy-D-mannose reductase